MKANQDLGLVRQLSIGAKFEPGAGIRRQLDHARSCAEKLMIPLLAIVQHKVDLPMGTLPQPLHQAYCRLNTAIAHFLEELAEETSGHDAISLPDLLTPLQELETEAAGHLSFTTDVAAAGHIRARLELCRQAVRIASQMERPTGGPS